MVDKAATARFVPLFRAEMTAEDAVPIVEGDVANMALPFTVVILGMGGDGHTASLFPDAPAHELKSAMDLASSDRVAILHPPSVTQTRISLTRAALLNSHARVVHITGDAKLKVLHDALLDTCQSTAESVAKFGEYAHGNKPIAGLVTHQPELVSVFWSP